MLPNTGGRGSISEYVSYKDADIYIRFLNWKGLTITLASISRDSRNWNIYINPKVKSTGFMDEVLNKIEERAFELGAEMVIEQVLNPFLPSYLIKRGYSAISEFSYKKEI